MKAKKLLTPLLAVIFAAPVSVFADLRSDIEAANVALAAEGLMIASAEWVTDGGSGEAGNIVYFNNRGNKQLGADFVPGDPERGGRTDINYIVDALEGSTTSGLNAGQTTEAIDAAMTTWDNIRCSAIPLSNLGAINFDLGYVQFLVGLGGFPGYAADLTHAGFLPRVFFDFIAPPNGGNNILGVTFTFIWVDDVTGAPTDMDNNGKDDVAFREIYYNDAFPWNVGSNFDVETVALHEAGHGLSQGHFGKAFRSKNGKLHFAPKAVMNAGYSGVQTRIRKSDNGGHCSNWAEWPNN